MRFLRLFLAILLIAGAPMVGVCADEPAISAATNAVAGTEAEAQAGHETSTHEAAKHELSAAPVDLVHIGPIPITNSMVLTWGAAAVLIIFARMATKNIKEIPSGAQNFWEWLVEGLYDFLDGIIGRDLAKKTFWFFASIFLFILAANWFGLIPGVGTIGWGSEGPHGFHITHPLLRGANADLNMTFGMSMVFFICWVVWALQANGPGGFILHLFGPKGETAGLLKVLMVVVFIAVGFLEVVSILFRPISLSFRLYGNVFAGESMLEAMSTIVPHWIGAVLIPIPFYFMELLVGLVQALVFMLLTAVFTLLICTHEEGHEGAEHH